MSFLWLKGVALIAWDLVKWCLSHPFHVATVVLAVAFWSARGTIASEREAHTIAIGIVAAELVRETARADTEKLNADGAAKTNDDLNKAIDTLIGLNKDNEARIAAVEAQKAQALRTITLLRKTADRAANEAAKQRSQLYEPGSPCHAWGVVPVCPATERVLRQAFSP